MLNDATGLKKIYLAAGYTDPVSYTHLYSFGKVSKMSYTKGSALTVDTNPYEYVNPAPVSYTHLDVYKRQLLWRGGWGSRKNRRTRGRRIGTLPCSKDGRAVLTHP